MRKKILSVLGILFFLSSWITVKAESVDVSFSITYLGNPSVDPTYIFTVQEPSLPTYETYTPYVGSYEIKNLETEEVITGYFNESGGVTVSGSWTYYVIYLSDCSAGDSIHINELSGMPIGEGEDASQGKVYTVANDSVSNAFLVRVGNDRDIEDLQLLASETITEELVEVEEQQEEVEVEEKESTIVYTETTINRDCSSYPEGYYWDGIRGACVAMPTATPEAVEPATLTRDQIRGSEIFVLIGGLLGVSILLFAIYILKKYRR